MPLHNLFYLALLTLIPFLELRASIPIGIAMGEPALLVFAVCVATNIALGPVVYFLLGCFARVFLRFRSVERIYSRAVERTQRRVSRYVERYGLLGIALFVAIPLPGSGSYTGALAAYLLGLGHKKFALANLAGVLVAGTLVTAGTLAAAGVLNSAAIM